MLNMMCRDRKDLKWPKENLERSKLNTWDEKYKEWFKGRLDMQKKILTLKPIAIKIV